MEIATHHLWGLIHGLGFGGLYLMACSGALVELHRCYWSRREAPVTARDETFLGVYLAVMAVLAWLTVFTGAYIIYPWYRAVPSPGTANLAAFPQRLLMSSPTTSAWHSIGMEWKEYVAWLVPISITMAAAVVFQYGRDLKDHQGLRNAVLGFVWISLFAAGIAGFFGAEIADHAPIRGGSVIHIISGGEK